jgi:hypothetical protein
MLIIVLDFFFICYMACGLSITRKYQKELERNYPSHDSSGARIYHGEHFKAVSQSAPSAPPPRNPNYAVA